MTLIVLSLDMLILWAYSGAVRGRVKATPNAEDAQQVRTQLAQIDQVIAQNATAASGPKQDR